MTLKGQNFLDNFWTTGNFGVRWFWEITWGFFGELGSGLGSRKSWEKNPWTISQNPQVLQKLLSESHLEHPQALKIQLFWLFLILILIVLQQWCDEWWNTHHDVFLWGMSDELWCHNENGVAMTVCLFAPSDMCVVCLQRVTCLVRIMGQFQTRKWSVVNCGTQSPAETLPVFACADANTVTAVSLLGMQPSSGDTVDLFLTAAKHGSGFESQPDLDPNDPRLWRSVWKQVSSEEQHASSASMLWVWRSARWLHAQCAFFTHQRNPLIACWKLGGSILGVSLTWKLCVVSFRKEESLDARRQNHHQCFCNCGRWHRCHDFTFGCAAQWWHNWLFFTVFATHACHTCIWQCHRRGKKQHIDKSSVVEHSRHSPITLSCSNQQERHSDDAPVCLTGSSSFDCGKCLLASWASRILTCSAALKMNDGIASHFLPRGFQKHLGQENPMHFFWSCTEWWERFLNCLSRKFHAQDVSIANWFWHRHFPTEIRSRMLSADPQRRAGVKKTHHLQSWSNFATQTLPASSKKSHVAT